MHAAAPTVLNMMNLKPREGTEPPRLVQLYVLHLEREAALELEREGVATPTRKQVELKSKSLLIRSSKDTFHITLGQYANVIWDRDRPEREAMYMAMSSHRVLTTSPDVKADHRYGTWGQW